MTIAQFGSRLFYRALDFELARFLITGGTAAAINWFARIGLSFLVPFWCAILIAYAIGMLAGYLLYSTFVFKAPRSARSTGSRVRDFVLVNLISAGAVLVIALWAAQLLSEMSTRSQAEAVAHLFAIGCGAALNYMLHKCVTFR